MAKPKYTRWLAPDGIKLLEGWARRGLTDEQIAHNMGISSATYYKWQLDHSEIKEALKKGKEIVDIEVENALLKRALGYTYDETKVETDAHGRKRGILINHHVPPDVTAQIFWLKNRRPDLWRDKPVYIPAADEIDDGFIDALKASAANLKDDSDFLPEDD